MFSLENKTFANFVFYGSLAIGKTMLMSALTAYYRFKTKSFSSLEDARAIAPENVELQKRMLVPNEEVERVRKAHRNDLENVIPFVLLGVLYVGTDPPPTVALWHFRIFLTCRILHTLIYVRAVRQPFRFLFFFGGYFVSGSMIAQSIAASYKYL